MQEEKRGIGKKRAKKGRFGELYEWIESIVCAMLCVVLIFTFGVRTAVVSGQSMFDTLKEGDMLLISRLGGAPERGDIVVATKPYHKDEPIIKRVIAVGGQKVDINFEEGIVYVDGEMIDEPYANTPTNRQYDMEFPVTVPEGSVFLLGDNRNYSYDSRGADIGFVDERYILGEVLIRLMPFDSFGKIPERG